MRIDVIEAGAVADGKTLVTEVVQKAVDACGENGGGIVSFHAGDYLMGKVALCSHMTVKLESGCRIIASPDEKDYPSSPGMDGTLMVGGRNTIRGYPGKNIPQYWWSHFNKSNLEAHGNQKDAIVIYENGQRVQ